MRGRPPLGLALSRRGTEWLALDSPKFQVKNGEVVYQRDDAFDVDAVAWMLPASMLPAVRPILEAYEQRGVPVWNSSRTLDLCSDWRSAYVRLAECDVDAVPYQVVLPGHLVRRRYIAKSAIGGSGIVVGELAAGGAPHRVPLGIQSPWIEQENAMWGGSITRVLVVDGRPLGTYRQAPHDPHEAASIERVSDLDLYDLDVAVAAADACGAVIAGVDLTSDGAVLKVSATPDIPRYLIDDAALMLTYKLDDLPAK